MRSSYSKRMKTPYIILINIIIALIIVVLFVNYNVWTKEQMYEQNVNDVVNINQSGANISAAYFKVQQKQLSGIREYADSKHMTSDELMEYLVTIEATSEQSNYQLISTDGMGYKTSLDENGNYIPVDYSNYDYKELKKIFTGDVQRTDTDVASAAYTPEFTDKYNACKSVATYVPMILWNNGTEEYYTLMSVSKTTDIQKLVELDDHFSELSSVIIDEKGNYIINNNVFSTSNFFQYIATYNDLSLDEKNELRDETIAKEKGEMEYVNSAGKISLFVYTKVPDSNWYYVSGVPIDSFPSRSMEMSITAIIVILLVVLLFFDVVWFKSVNRILEENAKRAESANSAKTDFLSRMSHDIRTPLNVINGMTHLALEENNTKETVQYLKDIDSASKFLTGLVNDILDLNKVESGKMELHPAPYTYKEFRQYINAVIVPLCEEKNITFTMKQEVDEQPLILDSLRFNQIFFNLLSNAVKFTPEGGHIEFVTKAYSLDDNTLQLDYYVKDNGAGMSEEFQKHMFDSFTQETRTLTNEVKGSGLGLAIVKKMVMLMGGSISVESKLGEGTTFRVRLRALVAKDYKETENVKGELEQQTSEILQGKRILLCEDHPMNTVIAVKLLEREGMVVETAENGLIGVEMFKNSELGYYDAILMDIRMPIMTGLDATKAIRMLTREDAKGVPIIAMTANAYDVDVQKSKDVGMNAHLAKPIEPELLYHTLEKYIFEKQV